MMTRVLPAISLSAVLILALGGCHRSSSPAPAHDSTKIAAEVSGDKPAPPLNSPLRSATFASRDLEVLASCHFSNGREAGMNSMLEIVGGGVGCVDFDNDGSVDLLFPRGGHIDPVGQRVTGLNVKLLRAQGTFNYADATDSAAIETSRIHSHGVCEVDYDHDGYCDLLVYGFNGIELLRNLGDGSFQPVAQASGLSLTNWTTAAAWMDFNGDGHLDLYLGSYVDWNFQTHTVCPNQAGVPDVCSPNVFAGQTNSLYLNTGDGTFAAASDFLPPTQPSKTLAALAAEFIPGQGPSLYVTNDMIANFFFTRRGTSFQEQAFAVGVAVDDDGVANASMGIALLDFNLDLKPDLFVTNFENERMALYLNYAEDGFHYHSRPAGLNRNDLQLVAFGVVAADFDGDADEDVLFCSGHVHYHPDRGPMEQLPAYLQNEGGTKFSKPTPDDRFFQQPTVGRGLATADLDNDGDLDVVSTSLSGSPALLENTTPSSSSWLMLQLVGTRSPRWPVGTTVILTAGRHRMLRQLPSGGSYLSQNQSHLHFAWPEDRPALDRTTGSEVSLQVVWPTGQTDTMKVTANQQLVIVEKGNTQ